MERACPNSFIKSEQDKKKCWGILMATNKTQDADFTCVTTGLFHL